MLDVECGGHDLYWGWWMAGGQNRPGRAETTLAEKSATNTQLYTCKEPQLLTIVTHIKLVTMVTRGHSNKPITMVTTL